MIISAFGMYIVCSFLQFVAVVIIYAVLSGENINSKREDSADRFLKSRIFRRITLPINIILLIFSFYYIYSSAYLESIKDIYKLKASYHYNMGNFLHLSNTINEKAVIKEVSDKVIIDVANFSQSTRASEAYTDYVQRVSAYNWHLADSEAIRYDSIISRLVNGWLCPIPKDIKYISIKD